MRLVRYLPLFALTVLVLATGCRSTKFARSRPPPQDNSSDSTYTDMAARGSYMSQRVEELTREGVPRQAAIDRASREWFARSSATRRSATPAELKRREAQADLNSYLDQRKDQGSP